MAARGTSVRDLEKLMGRKADHVSKPVFDPETFSWSRRITFKLDKKKTPPKKRAAKRNAP